MLVTFTSAPHLSSYPKLTIKMPMHYKAALMLIDEKFAVVTADNTPMHAGQAKLNKKLATQ